MIKNIVRSFNKSETNYDIVLLKLELITERENNQILSGRLNKFNGLDGVQVTYKLDVL